MSAEHNIAAEVDGEIPLPPLLPAELAHDDDDMTRERKPKDSVCATFTATINGKQIGPIIVSDILPSMFDVGKAWSFLAARAAEHAQDIHGAEPFKPHHD